MPGQYVNPYVKRNKTDAADAEAICEAVTRPSMRFVSIRSAQNQAVLLQHRSREILVKQRTMLVNAVRGHMAEFGIVTPKGLANVAKLQSLLEDSESGNIPTLAKEILNVLFDQIGVLSEQIEALQQHITQEHRANATSQRLASIPGIGPLSASAILATVGDISAFKSGREFAAWLGLTPLEHSSGDKRYTGGISKRGDGYLRRLLVHGARAVVRMRNRKGAAPFPWLDDLLERLPRNTATVALANKNARMIWALLTKEETFKGYILHRPEKWAPVFG